MLILNCGQGKINNSYLKLEGEVKTATSKVMKTAYVNRYSFSLTELTISRYQFFVCMYVCVCIMCAVYVCVMHGKFGKLTNLTSYQAKSRDKLVNPLVNSSIVWLVSFPL